VEKQDKAEMAFKLYDKDKDGYITKAEMTKLSKTLTKDQIDKVHCYENPIYGFPEKELRGLSHNFPVHVSVSDLYTVVPGSFHINFPVAE
jgi:hypothetical protein